MLDDIFANNEKRLRNLRSQYSAETIAAMVNVRLNEKNIKETVTGSDIDGFLKLSRLGKNKALVPKSAYIDAINIDALPTT